MPLKKDPAGGGTNADGSLSAVYCSFCSADVRLLHPDFDVRRMQDHCVQQLRGKGLPRPMAWLFTRGVPRLQHWRKA